jgi:hypothetical protein
MMAAASRLPGIAKRNDEVSRNGRETVVARVLLY